MVFVVSAFPKVCGSGVMEAVNAGFRCVGIGILRGGIKTCLVTTLMLGTLTVQGTHTVLISTKSRAGQFRMSEEV